MIIKEYVSKDTQGKNRVYVDIECQVCTTIFSKQKRQIKSNYYTCSRQCLSLAKGSAVELACDHCGGAVIKPTSKLSGSKSGKYFCTRECKDIAQTYMVEIQPDHYGTVSKDYRAKALRELPHVCVRCSFSNVNALEVHHKDKNRSNNDISNLEILCANCHSIEHRS